MNPLTQALISGLMMGTVYALLATGLAIVYHTAQIVNIAHGEAYAVAGIVAAAVEAGGAPLWIGLLAGIGAAVLFVLVLERVLLRPRRSWSVNSLILVTLAVAFFMRGLGVSSAPRPRIPMRPSSWASMSISRVPSPLRSPAPMARSAPCCSCRWCRSISSPGSP